LVSVVVPFFDTPAAFLREALESIAAQTYTAWELILVDDGSKGPCLDVVEAFVARDPGRIRRTAHPDRSNHGPSASRNLGVELARGAYVGFLDADDYWLPTKLVEQVRLLEENPRAGWVYGPTLYWYGWSHGRSGAPPDFTPPLGVPADTLLEPPTLLARFVAGRASVPCMGSLLARLDLVRSFGGFESGFQGLYEDQPFYAKLALAAPVFASSSCLDRYRQHPDSMMGTASASTERAKHVEFLDWLEGYLAELDVRDGELWRALAEARWKLRHPVLARALRTGRLLLTRVFPTRPGARV
jgi:glycosyltransferase involved in cell wall biosynthesis